MRSEAMEFGVSIFFTDYSITPAELAVALEERGFDSVWAAEHSHIPVPRRTRADTELGKRYYDVMDPFVTLTAAACNPLRRRLVPERGERRTGGLRAGLPRHGKGGRARSCLVVIAARRGPRRPRQAEAISRYGRRCGQRDGDVGTPRPDSIDPRPLGRAYPPAARLRTGPHVA